MLLSLYLYRYDYDGLITFPWKMFDGNYDMQHCLLDGMWHTRRYVQISLRF